MKTVNITIKVNSKYEYTVLLYSLNNSKSYRFEMK